MLGGISQTLTDRPRRTSHGRSEEAKLSGAEKPGGGRGLWGRRAGAWGGGAGARSSRWKVEKFWGLELVSPRTSNGDCGDGFTKCQIVTSSHRAS